VSTACGLGNEHRGGHHTTLSPSRLALVGWPRLCPARFVRPVSTALSYLSSTVHACPLLLSLCPTKPDHVSSRHLCLQALGSSKPRRYCVFWTVSFHSSYLLFLVWPDVFALRLPCFVSDPHFCLRLAALHSPLHPTFSFYISHTPDRLLCPPLTLVVSRSLLNV
jgi:hypothetical protein